MNMSSIERQRRVAESIGVTGESVSTTFSAIFFSVVTKLSQNVVIENNRLSPGII